MPSGCQISIREAWYRAKYSLFLAASFELYRASSDIGCYMPITLRCHVTWKHNVTTARRAAPKTYLAVRKNLVTGNTNASDSNALYLQTTLGLFLGIPYVACINHDYCGHREPSGFQQLLD